MSTLWLIRIGEITLKKGNRPFFERILRERIKFGMKLICPKNKVDIRPGRFYLETEASDEKTASVLCRTAGIVSFSRVLKAQKDLSQLKDQSISVARKALESGVGKRFKFEVRRIDKSLPLDSYGYARELGHAVLQALPELSVDVHNPDFTIRVELREWAYIYQGARNGMGGLPVGSAGKGMLLLSGGIDSPVAGYMMAKRGIRLIAIHFHTPPFTSSEAHEKALRLTSALAPWCGGLTVFSVPFTDCQTKINQSVNHSAITLHTRACMMRAAEKLGIREGCKALVTGESLAQVASQTMESLAFTNSVVQMPVFRPLVGMDKEEIIGKAQKMGTYKTSIEPFEDCCTVFTPANPLTRPRREEELAVHEKIENLEELIEASLDKSERTHYDALGKKRE